MNDKPQEECGVFGIFAPGREAARLTFFGLYALQHRGQEGAGIVTSDGQRAYAHKAMGLVSQIFTEGNLAPLQGHLAIGHTRYSTTGGVHVRNLQPYLIETLHGPMGLAHNGNLTNALVLRQILLQRGVGLSSTSDTELMTQILAAPAVAWNHDAVPEETDDYWLSRIQALMHLAEGAYSIAILTRDALYAIRDPYGLRPLCLGKLGDGYVVASESCALSTIGADYIREIEAGEIVRINRDGMLSFRGRAPEKAALCSFEHVYFARPDSILNGQMVHQVRQSMGRQLAREAPTEADIVAGVPDSAIPAALGYSQESGIAYSEGLTKNRYIGRTFIQPDEGLRQHSISLKYNALTANLQGKRVVLVDDSIVRGNTARPLVQLLRDGGATEVHMRISSPPVKHPCFMGVDMASYDQLIAHKMTLEESRQHIGADSLAYLSHEGMLSAIQEAVGSQNSYCTACFSGKYPLFIPEWLFAAEKDKLAFEGAWG